MNNRTRSLLLPIMLGLSLFISLWVQTNINYRFNSDLGIYLRAGQKVLQKENPYQPFEIGKSFIYPPTALLIFAPLSLSQNSKVIWSTLSLMSLLLILSISLHVTPVRLRPVEVIWLTAGALIYAPFWEQLSVGQINTLLLLGIAAYVQGILNPAYRWIGDWGLALAISIKITPLVLLAFPFFCKDWRRCLRTLSGVLVLLVASMLFFGLEPWRDFLEISPRLFQVYPYLNSQTLANTINWFARTLAVPVDFSWVGSLFTGLVLLTWIGALFFHVKKSNPVALLCFGIVSMTVSSSLIWYHHLVFLLMPILFLILSAEVQTPAGQAGLLLTLVGTLLIQIDRVVEARLVVPPLPSIFGYLAIYLAAGLKVYFPAPRSTPPALPAADAHSTLLPARD